MDDETVLIVNENWSSFPEKLFNCHNCSFLNIMTLSFNEKSWVQC